MSAETEILRRKAERCRELAGTADPALSSKLLKAAELLEARAAAREQPSPAAQALNPAPRAGRAPRRKDTGS